MAELNPPTWLQGGSYSAELDRLALAALFVPAGADLKPRAGVLPRTTGYELAVKQSATPAMSVLVDPGQVLIPGTRTATQAGYVAVNDGAKTLTVATSHATLPRKDLVVARVYDAAYAGTSNLWALEVLAGTPAASPAAPAVPSDAIALAEISVAAAATSVVNANLTDRRVYTLPGAGPLPVTSTTRPSSPYVGLEIYERDTGARRLWDGASWRLESSATGAALPEVILRRTSDLSLSASTSTAIPWQASDKNVGGMWSSGANVTIAEPGVYAATVTGQFGGSGSANAGVKLLVNGTAISGSGGIAPVQNESNQKSCGFVRSLAAGDVVTAEALATEAMNLQAAGGGASTGLTVVRVA